MPRKKSKSETAAAPLVATPAPQACVSSSAARPSALVDTRVIYCGDNLDELKTLPDACIDLVYIDPPFNSNRNYEVFWGETREKRSFADRHESTAAYIDFMRPRCLELARVKLVPCSQFGYTWSEEFASRHAEMETVLPSEEPAK